jgi:hypothetical protein
MTTISNEQWRQMKHERDELRKFVIASYHLINSEILKHKAESVFTSVSLPSVFDHDKVKAQTLEAMLEACDFKGWVEFATEMAGPIDGQSK